MGVSFNYHNWKYMLELQARLVSIISCFYGNYYDVMCIIYPHEYELILYKK